MDRKAKQVLDELHTKISVGSFSELDVYLLLVILRECVDKNDLICELADFVAHRRRDRGAVHKKITELQEKIQSHVSGTLAHPTRIQVDSICTAGYFRERLNDAFKDQDLSSVDEKTSANVLACIISLFQDIAVRIEYNRTAQLVAWVIKGQIQLNGEFHIKKDKGWITISVPVIESGLRISDDDINDRVWLESIEVVEGTLQPRKRPLRDD
jgi:hypothetical protein